MKGSNKASHISAWLQNYLMMLLFRAVHNLPWGTLESEEVLVEVTEPLGKVSLIINITVMANIINMPHVRNCCFS